MNDKIKSVCGYLDNIPVNYEITEHSPAATIEECRKIEKILNAEICKNLFLRTGNCSSYYLLILRNDKPFVTSKISKLLGSSRLSFASGEEMETLLNTSPGSLSILSLIFDNDKKIRLAIDKDVIDDEFFCCHPCDNSATLKLKSSDITNVILPAMGISPIIIET